MKELVREKIHRFVEELYGFKLEGFKVEKPKDESLGDLSTNAAFLLAKELGENPKNVAERIAEAFSREKEFESVQALKGFVNFRFSKSYLVGEFKKLLSMGKEYYRKDLGKGMRVQVEFVSANPTGPLHLGHGRGAVLGDTLARLMSFYGFDITREYYINDWGRQVYLLGVSVFRRYLELIGKEQVREDLKELFEKEGYRGEYILDIARALREAVGDDLISLRDVIPAREKVLSHKFNFPLTYTRDFVPEKDPPVELCTAFGLDMMMAEIREDLRSMGIEFDTWFSERELHKEGLVSKLVESLKEKDYVYEEGGALWLRTSEFGDEKDRVLVKKEGSYTYFASDIAYHWDKYRRGFDRVIDLWGADHHGYVPRVKASLRMLGIPEDWLEVYLVQMVRLMRGGKEVRMSKRAGTFVPLRELVEEVGADAVRFVFLTKRSDTPLELDVEKLKEKSLENPVFYVQYAHARISGVFREVRERKGIDPEKEDLSDYLEVLCEDIELKLMRKVIMFKDELIDITLRREPHLITYFLMDLAGDFHYYYNHYRVIVEREDVMKGRIALLKGIGTALRLGLELAGVSAPSRM